MLNTIFLSYRIQTLGSLQVLLSVGIVKGLSPAGQKYQFLPHVFCEWSRFGGQRRMEEVCRQEPQDIRNYIPGSSCLKVGRGLAGSAVISTLFQAFISNDVVQTPYLEAGRESAVRPTGGSLVKKQISCLQVWAD